MLQRINLKQRIVNGVENHHMRKNTVRQKTLTVANARRKDIGKMYVYLLLSELTKSVVNLVLSD